MGSDLLSTRIRYTNGQEPVNRLEQLGSGIKQHQLLAREKFRRVVAVIAGDNMDRSNALVMRNTSRDDCGNCFSPACSSVVCLRQRIDSWLILTKAARTAWADIKDRRAACESTGVAPRDHALAVSPTKTPTELDRNFIGGSNASVGASNDATTSMGPPKYDDARFTFKCAARQELKIHLRDSCDRSEVLGRATVHPRD